MRLFVRGLEGRTLCVEAGAEDDVAAVQRLISEKEGVGDGQGRAS